MRLTLRRLERVLISERTQLGVTIVVDRFIDRWHGRSSHCSPTPDPIDLATALIRAGFYLPGASRAITYLDECRRRNALPDRQRVLQILLWP